MRRLYLSVSVYMMLMTSISAQSPTVTPATGYLQHASDQYQGTIDVYTVADAAGNHFAARGEFDNAQSGTLVPAMDEISSNAPCYEFTCITGLFDPAKASYGGWYLLNGILGATDRVPSANWGTVPNAGYDLSGATALQFRARGATGGEQVEFFAFGVGNTVAPFAPYPDSSLKVSFGIITLTSNWTLYSKSLTGVDLHYTLGGFGWAATAANNSGPITFYIDDIQYIKDRSSDPRFLVSYETIKSQNAFDTVERNAAFVYDNCVALIALVAAGDLTHARTIADALRYAMANDRFFTDNRLRNAYQGGDIMLPPGWVPNGKSNTVRMSGWYDPTRSTWFEDVTQVSSNTGNVAWAILALLDFYEATNEQKYLQGAEQLGNWVIANTSDNRGSGGFTGGYDGWENGATSGSSFTCVSNVIVNGQCKRLYKSTEHNIDLYAAFSRLYVDDHQNQWTPAANQAKAFLTSMWNSDPTTGGYFWTGTVEDGITVNEGVIPVDIQAWAIQALGADAQPYIAALNYVETHHKTTLGYGFKQDGDTLCGDHTWFEGTSQVAEAYLLAGNRAKWQSILDNENSTQLPSGAMPATDGDNNTCVNTGFILDNGQPWEYFHRAHVGATAWRSVVENGVNPFRSSLYSPAPQISLNPASLSFGAQNDKSSSPTQVIQLTNFGSAALSFSGISLTGANAIDFAIQSGSTCAVGSSLQPNASCVISVAFSPASPGSKSAAITITDNALGSPHVVALFGTAQDFSISVASGAQNTQTVSPGGSASYTLAVSPLGGFNKTVSLTCAVAPTNVVPPVCTVSPASATLDGVSVTQITLSVKTAAPLNALGYLRPGPRVRSLNPLQAPPWFICLIAMACLAGLTAVSSTTRRNFRPKAIAYLMAAAALSMASCSTGCGNSTGPSHSGTPTGSYSVTVSGTNESLTNSATVTLVVQ
jgi:hypothetical protein